MIPSKIMNHSLFKHFTCLFFILNSTNIITMENDSENELRSYLAAILSDNEFPCKTDDYRRVASPDSYDSSNDTASTRNAFKFYLDSFDDKTMNNSSTDHKALHTQPASQPHNNENLRKSPRHTQKRIYSDYTTSYSSDSDNQIDSSSKYDNHSKKMTSSYTVNSDHQKRTRHDETDREYCINLFEQGSTVLQIHEKTNIPSSTIYSWNRTECNKGKMPLTKSMISYKKLQKNK